MSRGPWAASRSRADVAGNRLAKQLKTGSHRHLAETVAQLPFAHRLPAGNEVRGNFRNHVVMARAMVVGQMNRESVSLERLVFQSDMPPGP